MGGGREKDSTAKMEQNSKNDKKASVPAENTKSKTTKTNERITPPDGGWGWMVVLASFMIHVIADGIVYSFGIFYIEFLDYYKSGKGETAWVGSLVPGVTLSVGPVAGILTNKYGCRATTIAGSIIAASGFILSIFSPNLHFLYFSFGIMSGLGFGLIYLPAIVSVGQYFEEKRAFATGLAVCGSGIGAFIFNPLSKYLIDEFGWHGAILIEAGIILNCVPCGVLFRALDSNPKVSKSEESIEQEEPLMIKDPRDLVKEHVELELFISATNIPTSDQVRGDMVTSQPTSPTHTPNTLAILDDPQRNTVLFRSEGALNRHSHKPATPSPLTLNHSSTVANTRQHFRRQLSEDHHRHLLTPGGIYQSGSLLNISLMRSQPGLYVTSLKSIHDTDSDVKKKMCCFNVSYDVYDSMKQMCDLTLLKDVIFLMFVVSNFCTSIGFNMPFIFLTDRAVDEGIDKESAKWLVSIIGISNTVGRVVFGFLADRPSVNRLMLYNTALTICGVATALCPLCFNYPLLVLYAIVFGLFIGVYVSLTSVVLVDLLGLDMLVNSFGLLLMFQGFATLIGPPIAGWLYDGTGSYDVSFIVAGVIVAISGIMLYFIPLVRRLTGMKARESSEEMRELEPITA